MTKISQMFLNKELVKQLTTEARISRGQKPPTSKRLKFIGADMSGPYINNPTLMALFRENDLSGVQNARFRNLVRYLARFLDITIIEGNAKNEDDGSVTATFEGGVSSINLMTKVLKIGGPFWVFAEGGPANQTRSNVRVQSGLPVTDPNFVATVDSMLRTWGAILVDSKTEGQNLLINVHCVSESRNEILFDHLTRNPLIKIAEYSFGSFSSKITTEFFPMDKIIDVADVTVTS